MIRPWPWVMILGTICEGAIVEKGEIFYRLEVYPRLAFSVTAKMTVDLLPT
jgi:hypothetical protein